MLRQHFYYISFTLLPLVAAGQTEPVDTVGQLPAVELIDTRLRVQHLGSRSESWEVEALARSTGQSLAELLGRESGVYIKTYGGGSLATSSLRGGGAGHTAVVWNGFVLQSPMLGLLDLSLLPLDFTDRVAVRYGGQSSAWGSGAIGGVIALDNEAVDQPGLSLALRSTVGSFGHRHYSVQGTAQHGQWTTSTRLLHQQADNDFPYRLRPDLPERRQVHAGFLQQGLLQEIYWQPTPGQQLALRAWWQRTERDIPPTTVQNRSQASQYDDFLRTALHWRATGRHTIWQARTAVFHENLDYRDALIQLRSLSRFRTVMTEVEAERYWTERRRLQFGLSHYWLQAWADNYDQPPQQHRLAAFAAWREQWGRWRAQFNIRQEMTDGRLLPPTPSLGVEGELTNWLSLHLQVSRNYRLPTFNDLYWQPGGNPDLRPENGWSREASLKSQRERPNYRWSYQLTAFDRRIRDWIIWAPGEVGAIWSPYNLTQVHSRGLEQRLGYQLVGSRWRIGFDAGHDWIWSTNEVEVAQPRMIAGEQLAYTPRHRAFAGLLLHWRRLEMQYRHTYTAEVRALNQEKLDGFQLGDLYLSASLDRPRWNGTLFVQAFNLWNVDYRVVERRPMPGRHFRVGLRWAWNSAPDK